MQGTRLNLVQGIADDFLRLAHDHIQVGLVTIVELNETRGWWKRSHQQRLLPQDPQPIDILPPEADGVPLCQKNPAPTLTVSASMVVLKKNANMQCRVVILRMFLDVTLTSAVAVAVPMTNE
jgi:hypothetical protein